MKWQFFLSFLLVAIMSSLACSQKPETPWTAAEAYVRTALQGKSTQEMEYSNASPALRDYSVTQLPAKRGKLREITRTQSAFRGPGMSTDLAKEATASWSGPVDISASTKGMKLPFFNEETKVTQSAKNIVDIIVCYDLTFEDGTKENAMVSVRPQEDAWRVIPSDRSPEQLRKISENFRSMKEK